MDLFDRCILTVFRDGKSRDFHQLLEEVDFSHNTLRLHLRRLVDQGLIVKEKTPVKGRGRPRFTCSLPPKLHRQALKRRKKTLKNECSSLWTRSVMNWDGTIFPCCNVYEKKWGFGNALEEGFTTIWNNNDYRSSRERVANGKIAMKKNNLLYMRTKQSHAVGRVGNYWCTYIHLN